jgi:Tol biopolymer transport system component
MLPDGRRFVFTIRSSSNDVPGIYLGSIDSPLRTRLVADLSNAAYARSSTDLGYLLFVRGRSLLAQRLDVEGRRLTGEPTVVAENVWVSTERSRAAFSISETGVLVFDTVTRGRDTELASFDRRGVRQASFGQFAPAKISLSPDGTRLALDNFETTGTFKLWTVDLTRGIPSRWNSTLEKSDRTPVWSSDGTRIAFASDEGIFERSASDGGDVSLLLKSDQRISLDDWSRDGRFLLFRYVDFRSNINTRESGPSNADLWILPMAAAGDRTPIALAQTGSNASNGAFSPNGKWIAYDSEESGGREIYVRAMPTAGQAVSGAKWRVSKGGGRYPRWRDDGRELLYFADDLSALLAVSVRTETVFEAGTPEPLFRGRLNTGITPSFATSDGQRFFIAAPVPAETTAPATVVLNWTAALKK